MTTTTQAVVTVLRTLASGALVLVAPDGSTSPFTCSWLVQVSTASLYPPEAEWYPDSPADVWTLVECGARVRAHPGYGVIDGEPEATVCDHGHEHLPLEVSWAPFGPTWQAEQLAARDEADPFDRLFV